MNQKAFGRYIDPHVHLSLFLKNVDEIISQAQNEGIEKMIAVCGGYDDAQMTLCLSERYADYVFPAIGISYGFAMQTSQRVPLDHLMKEVDRIEMLTQENRDKIIAIGEIGIDSMLTRGNRYEEQKMVFRRLVEIAEKNGKGVIVHSVRDLNLQNSEKDALDILSSYDVKPVVMHYFQGNEEDTKTTLDRGYYFSAAPRNQNGELTKRLRRVVEQVPIDRLLAESDASERSTGWVEPTVLPLVVEQISEIKGRDVSAQLYENACRLFF